MREAGIWFAHGDRDPFPCEHHHEHVLVGNVIADEERQAAGKRCMLHQLAHGRGFVEACLLDLHHRFTTQEFERYSACLRGWLRLTHERRVPCPEPAGNASNVLVNIPCLQR
jgi:hypothetical protein